MKAHGHFVYSTECLNMDPEVLETRRRDHEQGLRGCKKGVQRKVENSIKGERPTCNVNMLGALLDKCCLDL